MNKTIIVAGMALAACAEGIAAGLASDAEADAKAAEVLKTLTLEEKVSLLSGAGTMFLNAIPEKGIRREWTFSDNSNSIRADMTRFDWIYSHKDPQEDSSTVLPVLSALASTWNRDLAALHGDILGAEMLVRGKDQLLGPGVNLMRTPLCGRNWEYLSEDPYLSAKLVVPMIRALQSHGVAATVKHFAANEQELNRHSVDTEIDERTLREIYLVPFEAAVREGGALSVMSSYNKFRGRWASENYYLLTEILRNDWGFKGMCVTDWGGQHSTNIGALAGQDVECNQGYQIRYYQNPWLCWKKYKTTPLKHSDRETQPLVYAVKDGRVPVETVDRMATHVLWTMAKCRFFDQPAERVAKACNPLEHQKGARMIGEEAVTLLKNEKGILPLDPKTVKTLLLVGNLADARHTVGGWSAEGNPPYDITVSQAFAERGVRVVKAPLVASDTNAGVHDIKESCIETIDENAKDSGMTVRGWKMLFWGNRDQKGNPSAKGFMADLKADWHSNSPAKGCKAGNFSCRWTAKIVAPESGEFVFAAKASHKSGTRIRVDGKTVMDDWNGKNSSLAAGRVALKKGKSYKVEVDYRTGDGESTCQFGWLYPSEAGMSLDEVRDAALAADAVIVFTGTSVGHGRAFECEGADRPDMKLPAGHDEAISAILGLGLDRLIVVNHSGSPVEMPWISKCDTLVQEPYLGQEGGRPLASVIFGDVNPSGKLPCVWPVKYEDTAVAYYNAKGYWAYSKQYSNYAERFHYGYRWHDLKGIAPMFPFGYGLSYTTFEYGEPKVEGPDPAWKVTVPVTNTGKVDGKETVQLYVAAIEPKVERCVKDLRDFAKVSVKAGETVSAELTVTLRDLAYWDVERHCFRVDSGRYELLIGASSSDIRRRVTISLTEDCFL